MERVWEILLGKVWNGPIMHGPENIEHNQQFPKTTNFHECYTQEENINKSGGDK